MIILEELRGACWYSRSGLAARPRISSEVALDNSERECANHDDIRIAFLFGCPPAAHDAGTLMWLKQVSTEPAYPWGSLGSLRTFDYGSIRETCDGVTWRRLLFCRLLWMRDFFSVFYLELPDTTLRHLCTFGDFCCGMSFPEQSLHMRMSPNYRGCT